MIILNSEIISKIESMKRYEKVQIGMRTIYILVLIMGTLASVISGNFEEFSCLIVICVIATYIVGIICDCVRSEFDTVLQVLEYEKCKLVYEHSEDIK